MPPRQTVFGRLRGTASVLNAFVIPAKPALSDRRESNGGMKCSEESLAIEGLRFFAEPVLEQSEGLRMTV